MPKLSRAERKQQMRDFRTNARSFLDGFLRIASGKKDKDKSSARVAKEIVGAARAKLKEQKMWDDSGRVQHFDAEVEEFLAASLHVFTKLENIHRGQYKDGKLVSEGKVSPADTLLSIRLELNLIEMSNLTAGRMQELMDRHYRDNNAKV